jgi:hypothetical protein
MNNQQPIDPASVVSGTTKIVAPNGEWEINITPVLSDIKFYSYGSNLFRIEIKPEILTLITKDLFKPRTIPSDRQVLLQKIEGLVIKLANLATNTYTFVGYMEIPGRFIHTFFHNGMLISKSFNVDRSTHQNDDVVENLERTDYSIPFSEERSEGKDLKNYRKQCFRAYLEGVGYFSSRSRGEYYCIFRLSGKRVAISRSKLYTLGSDSELDLYTREALNFIYSIAGYDIEKNQRGDHVSNHTETTYVLACVRNKTNVFHHKRSMTFTNETLAKLQNEFRLTTSDTKDMPSFMTQDATWNSEIPDVHYINSNLPSCFYLKELKRIDLHLHLGSFENGEQRTEVKKVPYPNPLWVNHYVGASRNLTLEQRRIGNPTYDGGEFHSTEVYLSDLMTTVVYSTEKEFLIDMLTLESSDIFHVAKKIKLFHEQKTLVTNQYCVKWPERYSSALELATDLFRDKHELLSLLEPIGTSLPIEDKALRGFIRALYNGKTPVKFVKEKVERQLAAGEYFTNKGTRLYLSQYENFYIGTTCYCSFTKTVESVPYTLRFVVSVNEHTLKVVPSSITISISSSRDKIVKFANSLVVQRKKKGAIDIEEAYRSSTVSAESLTQDFSAENKKLEEEIELGLKRLSIRSKLNNLILEQKRLEAKIAKLEEQIASTSDTIKREHRDQLEQRKADGEHLGRLSFVNMSIAEYETYLGYSDEEKAIQEYVVELESAIEEMTETFDTRTNLEQKEKIKSQVEAAKVVLVSERDKLKHFGRPETSIEDKKAHLERNQQLSRISAIDETSPINRVRIPKELLEKIILIVEHGCKDVQISLTEVEEYTEMLNKKSNEFTCSVFSMRDITFETDMEDVIIVRSGLLEETFTIQSSYELVPNYGEVELERPMNEFSISNVKRYEELLRKPMLYMLFTCYGFDYFFYEQLTSKFEKSSYLFNFYTSVSKEIAKSSDTFGIHSFFHTSPEDELEDLIVTEDTSERFTWKPFTGFQ